MKEQLNTIIHPKFRDAVYPYNGIYPTIDESVFVAHGAIILGDVHIKRDSSIWFNAVVRGDVHFIRIGERTNIQDLCMLHVTHNKYPLIIGDNVTVGHSAILHGCTIGNSVLIGMGAKILDRVVVEPYTLVAAGTVIPEGVCHPGNVLLAGVPAKVIRPLTSEECKKIDQSAQNYINYVAEYREQGYV